MGATLRAFVPSLRRLERAALLYQTLGAKLASPKFKPTRREGVEAFMSYDEEQQKRSRVVVETPNSRREVVHQQTVRYPEERRGHSTGLVVAVALVAVAATAILFLFLTNSRDNSSETNVNVRSAAATQPTPFTQTPVIVQTPLTMPTPPPQTVIIQRPPPTTPTPRPPAAPLRPPARRHRAAARGGPDAARAAARRYSAPSERARGCRPRRRLSTREN